MSKTMMFRNTMCIFALFGIMAFFFCFGVVANAAESGETVSQTYSYNLSYDMRGQKVGNYKNTKITIDGLSNLPYRMVGLKGESHVYDEGTDNAFLAYSVTFYYLVNDNLSLFSNNGLKVNRSAVKTKWNDVEVTSSDTITLSTISCSSITTNIPIFDGDEAGKAAALEYLNTGKRPEASYNDKIETPKLSFTSELKFYISNASDNYYIEMQGRNYTVDDIELYKDGVVWKYKYSTILKNDLSTWVDVNSRIQSAGEHSLFVYGKSSVSDLLSKYPIDGRTYYGGTNAIGNYFSGYSDALSQLKSLLSYHGSLYLGSEIYVRFYVIDDSGNIEYGKWCHWFDNLAKAGGSSGSRIDDGDNIDTGNQSDVGLTDKDKNKLEDSGKPKTDPDAKPDKDYITSTNLWSYMDSLVKNLGDFPTLIASVFTFFPAWLTNLIFIGIGFIIILRFLGR